MALKRSSEHPVNVYYGYQTIGEFQRSRRLEGPFRVFVFCLLAIVLPCVLLVIPLYLRYEFYKDVTYHLGESDLVTVDQPISTIWCSEQELRMNATFHAYLLNQQPEISEDLKQIEMQKHMQLADDTLEYWGFFLLQGSKVTLSVCSRYDGARLMVVKGAKNLKHCALIDPSREDQIDPWEEDVSAPQGEKIKVTFQQGEIQTLLAQPPKKTKPTRNDSQKVTPLPNVSIHVDQSTDIKEGASRYASNRSRRGGGSRLTVATPPISNTRPASRSENSTNQGRHTGISRESWKVLRSRNGSRKRRFIMTEAEPSANSPTVDEAEDEAPPPVGVEADLPEAFDEEDIRSSGSSFAKNLWSCYGGDTLFTQTFSPSPRCQSQEAMMKYVRMKMVHEVTSTGYYYYIFYSDNDILSNDIFARFNIEKVEYRFPNYTNSCLNSTHCTLPLSFFSSEKVLLEVPIQDGVSDEDALAQIILISSCKPRHAVYIIFPVAILLIFILCAFI